MALLSKIALKATQGVAPFKYVGVVNKDNSNDLEFCENGVLGQTAKFAVEHAHNGLVHIRSCFNNKYWARSSANTYGLAAKGVEPVVDQTSWTCTLFRINITSSKKEAKFYHVQSGRTVRVRVHQNFPQKIATEVVSIIVDLDALVVLPKFVVFKGSNNLYYKNYYQGYWDQAEHDGCAHFSVREIVNPDIVCECRYTSDGHLRVRAANADSSKEIFWRCNGDSSQEGLIAWDYDDPTEPRQMFDVVEVGDGVVALRSLYNNKFCMRADYVYGVSNKDCLVAKANAPYNDARLRVEEPVYNRTVSVYEFDLDRARIYNVELLYSDEHLWDNYTDETQTGNANGMITTTKSRTYTNTITFSVTVKTTFETGIPFIAKGQIEVSATASRAEQWSQTMTDTQQIGHMFIVVVKPMKRTIARGTATKANCDVPFSYVQRDFPTNGGPPRVTTLYDGVFTGANAYSFQSEIRYEDLPPYKGPLHLGPPKCIKSIRPAVKSTTK